MFHKGSWDYRKIIAIGWDTTYGGSSQVGCGCKWGSTTRIKYGFVDEE